MKQTRVNIRAKANMAAIRRERRNGRDVIIVPSATLPDNVVMNGIKYPADEIKASFETLNRTPAPLGHPTINGAFVSASDPEGINIGWIGAHNENARQEHGRVMLDKVIDVVRANESPGGKAVLAAIETGDPIHTSTGLLCMLDDADGDDHDSIARDMIFDHDAILIGEDGAATPAQGVGMMVNSAGEEIQVINSVIEETDQEIDWAVEAIARAADRRERAPVVEQMKAAIMKALGLEREPNLTSNAKENTSMDKEQFDALSEKVNAIADTQSNLGEAIANAVKEAVKPLTDNIAEMQANAKAKDDTELAGHVEAIVKANILDEAAAGELTLNAARALAEKAKPGKAAALNGAFAATDKAPAFMLPKGDA